MNKYEIILKEKDPMFDGVSIGYNNIDGMGVTYLNLTPEVSKQVAITYLKRLEKELYCEKNEYELEVIDRMLHILEEEQNEI